MQTDKYSETQAEISGLIESYREKIIKGKGKGWKKFYGDIVSRIFKQFILEEIPENYKIELIAYISGFPTEFDLLIVDKDATPKEYTNAFEPTSVKCGIEIKASGIYAKRDELLDSYKKIKKVFDTVKEKYQHIEFFYLTYEEVTSPKKKGIDYLKEAKAILRPYEVYCLKNSRSGKPIEGEWERLVMDLNKCLEIQKDP